MDGMAKMDIHVLVPASIPEVVRPKARAARVDGSIVIKTMCLRGAI